MTWNDVLQEFMDSALAAEKKETYKQMEERGEEFIADAEEWMEIEPWDDSSNALYDDGYYAGMAKAFQMVKEFISNK